MFILLFLEKRKLDKVLQYNRTAGRYMLPYDRMCLSFCKDFGHCWPRTLTEMLWTSSYFYATEDQSFSRYGWQTFNEQHPKPVMSPKTLVGKKFFSGESQVVLVCMSRVRDIFKAATDRHVLVLFMYFFQISPQFLKLEKKLWAKVVTRRDLTHFSTEIHIWSEGGVFTVTSQQQCPI